jgi:hypothetical protein
VLRINVWPVGDRLFWCPLEVTARGKGPARPTQRPATPLPLPIITRSFAIPRLTYSPLLFLSHLNAEMCLCINLPANFYKLSVCAWIVKCILSRKTIGLYLSILIKQHISKKQFCLSSITTCSLLCRCKRNAKYILKKANKRTGTG